MSIVPGSVILFKSSGKWYEEAICYATHGPFCHVELALDATHTIGAHPHGIVISSAPINPNTYVSIDISGYTSQDKIKKALLWAVQQKGDGYGWTDILFQAIKFLWPTNPLRWGIEAHYDCSDLACRYLILAGVPMPSNYLDSYTVTPNDLWRFFSQK